MEYLEAWGTLIHEKNLKSKISCQTPFKGTVLLMRAEVGWKWFPSNRTNQIVKDVLSCWPRVLLFLFKLYFLFIYFFHPPQLSWESACNLLIRLLQFDRKKHWSINSCDMCWPFYLLFNLCITIHDAVLLPNNYGRHGRDHLSTRNQGYPAQSRKADNIHSLKFL